jgi:23S rRNA (pseudouridine1915-N3)-methyltransferase
MNVILYSFTTAKEPWFEEAKALYEKKIKHFCKFESIVLKSKGQSRDSQSEKLKSEASSLFSHLKSDDFLILFDEKSKEMNSKDFSKSFEAWLSSGKKRVVFVIGGAYGFDEAVKEKAQARISLSKMTMNHLVAEVVALEQIYRAFTIQKNIPYHNE